MQRLILPGTIYLTDDVDLISSALSQPRKYIIYDLDDQSNNMDIMFPKYSVKATVLNPPPSAVHKHCDGLQEEFIDEYQRYLISEDVCDIVALMIIGLNNGFDAFIYIPSFSEDSVWVNILLMYFETIYGIHVGTSAENVFSFNPEFQNVIASTLYFKLQIDILSYINLISDPSVPFSYATFFSQIDPMVKIQADLLCHSGIDENPYDTFVRLFLACQKNPNITPAVTFN